MATRNRPRFFRQAVRYFLRQTYEFSELIVVDDGEHAVEELCAASDRIRYVRLTGPAPTGTKLNIGIRHARGAILQKLDDDDYYHPDFLRLAVAQMEAAAHRERTVVAWGEYLVLFAGEQRFYYSGEGWAAGGTLCFSRVLWEKRNFRGVHGGSDSWFLADHEPEIVGVHAPEHYVLVRHGGNTWETTDKGASVDEQLRRLPLYPKPLEAVIDAADRAFYEAIRAEPRP